ncbi:MAG: CHAT domain-containing protein, partial [Acidobacteriota bacterium]
RRSGDAKAVAKAALARAYLSIFQGDLERAYVALAAVRPGAAPELRREYLVNLANVTQQTGRFRETRLASSQLAELGRETGDASLVVTSLSGLATTAKEELSEVPSPAGRKEVLALARRALEAARAAGLPGLEVQALWTIGSLVADPAEAKRQLERCLEVAATAQFRSYCQAVLARRLAVSDPAAAGEADAAALALAQESGDALSWVSAWHERMRARWSEAAPDRALADSLSALDAIEALRDQQEGSVRQPGLFSTWAEDYYWLSGKLLELGRLERAFGVIERMRARTLTDALGLRRPDVPPALHVRRAEVALAITRLQRRLLEESLSAADREAARSEIKRLETEADGIRLAIRKADPSLAGLRQPDFAALEQVRRRLGADEALLSFQVAPWQDLAGDFGGGSWLLVSTRAATRHYRLAGRTDLRPWVDAFNGQLAARDGSEAEVAAALYRQLLKPALADLPGGVRKLVIVPDDALHRLAFAALRPEPDGEPIGARFQISLVPSATLWLRWRGEPGPASGEPALVFADPPPSNAARLGPLALSREEGESVVGHLGGGSRLLLGEDASEALLKRTSARGFRLVHFATHSRTDDADPEGSFVYLARGGPNQDGLLQPREIAEQLDLRGRTVVLSTCESAAGEILRGEGVMGLARAFFLSGAHPVVASLWPLRDDDGLELFDRFYAHLAEGDSVAAALHAAQRDRSAGGAPAFAWAGVVVLGDGDRVPFPGGIRRPFLPALALVAALLAVAALLRRRIGAPRPGRR